MYHTFFVILLSVCIAAKCEGQVQLPPASAEPLTRAGEEVQVPMSEIRIFRLKYSEASSTARLLADLITTTPFRAVAEERTNSVVINGTADQLLAVEALLVQLDKAPNVLSMESNQNEKPTDAVDALKQIQQQIDQLRTEYETANSIAHQIAVSLIQTPNDAKKLELRTTVQRSFMLRQSLLRAELVQMQTRLLQTQQSIDMRERIADQIVDRRVEDLLNPELKWEVETSRVDETMNSEIPKHQQLGLRFAWDDAVKVAHSDAEVFESTANRVTGITLGSAAETAGFMVGDQLFAVNGLETWGRDSFVSTLRNQSIGLVECMLIRNGRQTTLELEIQPAPSAAMDATLSGPQNALLEKLQGSWDFQELNVENPEPRRFPNGPQMIYEIRGNRMASLANEPQMPTWHLRFGERGIPQAIDLNTSPDHVTDPTFLGIIEIADDVVRICLNNNSGENIKRPTEFAVTKDTDILELRRRPATVTELEGDWHLVSVTDMAGQSQEFSPANVSFNKDRYTFAYPYIQVDRRIQVYPDKKVIHYFSEGNDDYSESEYVLDGELLTIVDGSDKKARVYHRGHVPFPMSIRKVTEEQKSLWRSAIVDIFREYNSAEDGTRQDPVGKGVVISPKGLVICQVPEEIHQEKDSKTKFMVRFDDSSFAYATIVEEADHGWFALQPTQPSNHQFPIATSPMSVGDQVHLWACDSSTPPQRVTVGLAKVILLDRQTAKADTPVCQLTRPSDFRAESCPVLSGDGELLGITMRDTGDLVLAVPASQLKSMFPKTFAQ